MSFSSLKYSLWNYCYENQIKISLKTDRVANCQKKMFVKRLIPLCRLQVKQISVCNRIHQNAHNINFLNNSQQNSDCNRAVSEAEKILYPSSSLSPRWFMGDEISNFMTLLRNLNGCNHPLEKIAKNLIVDGKFNLQPWDFIILLVSKSAGLNIQATDQEQDFSSGLLHSQRALAEITDIIRTLQLIHQKLVNLQHTESSGIELSAHSDMIFGNKIALLGGDFLLANVHLQLAKLMNQEIFGLLFSAIRDLAESNFIGDRDDQNNPLPFDPLSNDKINLNYSKSEYVVGISEMDEDYEMDHCENEWIYRNTLSSASLLGKSCQGALKLAGHSESLQKNGFLFGKHLALASQAGMDLNEIQNETRFSLISAPILFHLGFDPSLYDEIVRGKINIENVDFCKIREIVINGPGIEKTQILKQKYLKSAMKAISEFPQSDSRNSLQRLLAVI